MSSITFTISQDRQGALISTPASQSATQRRMDISFTFANSVPKSFQFTGYTSTDTQQQLGQATISADGRIMTVPNANTKSETIVITSLISDGAANTELRSNSEVINEPPN